LPQTIPDEIELNLYRIIQEAFSNIEKHAQATRVTLRLGWEDMVLKAAIRDNGCGFDPAAPNPRTCRYSGMGLVDMKERAELVGGTLDIGRHWGVRAEFGFIHRRSAFLMANYRIPL